MRYTLTLLLPMALAGCIQDARVDEGQMAGGEGDPCRPNAVLACPAGFSAVAECPPEADCQQEVDACGRTLLCAPSDVGARSPIGGSPAGGSPEGGGGGPVLGGAGGVANGGGGGEAQGGAPGGGIGGEVEEPPPVMCDDPAICPEGSSPAPFCPEGAECYEIFDPCNDTTQICVDATACSPDPIPLGCPVGWTTVGYCPFEAHCVHIEACNRELICQEQLDCLRAETPEELCGLDMEPVEVCDNDGPDCIPVIGPCGGETFCRPRRISPGEPGICPLECPEGFSLIDEAPLMPGEVGIVAEAWACDQSISCVPNNNCFRAETPEELCPRGFAPTETGQCSFGERCVQAVGPCGGAAVCAQIPDCDQPIRCPDAYERVEVCLDDRPCEPVEICGERIFCQAPDVICDAEPVCDEDTITVSACPMGHPCERLEVCGAVTVCSSW